MLSLNSSIVGNAWTISPKSTTMTSPRTFPQWQEDLKSSCSRRCLTNWSPKPSWDSFSCLKCSMALDLFITARLLGRSILYTIFRQGCSQIQKRCHDLTSIPSRRKHDLLFSNSRLSFQRVGSWLYKHWSRWVHYRLGAAQGPQRARLFAAAASKRPTLWLCIRQVLTRRHSY